MSFPDTGWPRGTRFGVTRTDPRLLHRFLPQFVHSGYDAHTGILGGDYLGVLDVPGLDLAKDLEVSRVPTPHSTLHRAIAEKMPI